MTQILNLLLRYVLFVLALTLAWQGAAWFFPAARAAAPEIEQAKRLWARSPHGAMLERILPPAVEPRDLPERDSDGARLTLRYCVQCHHLPNPVMNGPTWSSGLPSCARYPS